jgi:hypothetical protein
MSETVLVFDCCTFFSIHQILEKKWEYNGTAHPFLGFKKAYDSVRREVFCSILVVWGTHESS